MMIWLNYKHVGYSAHRIPREPAEAAFAKAWQDHADSTLGYLLCGQDTRTHDYTERDAKVAATIIQWLGSPCGQGFIDEVRGNLEKRG